MIRCPNCGQAHSMTVEYKGDVYLVKLNEEMTEQTLFVNGVPADGKNPKREEWIKQFEKIPVDTVVKCDECHEVKTTVQRVVKDGDMTTEKLKHNTIKDWLDAFEDPLKFFEMEQLCHCGGELWMDHIPGTTQYGFVCEECNWVKPRATVSGGI
jgi:hypothetical protein